MNKLDKKITELFPGLVVRKDLVRLVKGNAIVPSYVLEYLLGQYCATSDEASIESGINTVREILQKHFVHRNEAGLIRSTIKEKGRHKVIDKVSVALNEKNDTYEAVFANLGIKKVLIDSGTVKSFPRLLVSGVWCISDIEYEFTEDTNATPWVLTSLKPIQLSNFDFDAFAEIRKQFTTDEWIDLLTQSIGFNPEMFGTRTKLLQLVRLIPYCERNYNVIELGPKGTGKSHIYSEFSPHGILLSGGEVTVPKLFVNNATGRIGLVGYWDVVAFDEFGGKYKKHEKALVDIMKNYMANKSFSRGIETLGAEASISFVGNTQHNVPFMLKHSNLFDDVPPAFYDSAFLDRLHYYIPGWEVDIIRGEMFSNGYGFVVDYLAEVLRALRNRDYSDRYTHIFKLSSDLSTRDRDGINKTFAGLMKILFPHNEASDEEIEKTLRFAMEGRKRVKDQLMRIDSTYSDVRFSYEKVARGEECDVRTLEESQYPSLYGTDHLGELLDKQSTIGTENFAMSADPTAFSRNESPTEQHLTFHENQRGVTFDQLFSAHVKGAKSICVTDPYLRVFYQLRNLMEFLETVAKTKADDEEIEVQLVTVKDDYKDVQQTDYLEQIKNSCLSAGIRLTWEFDTSGSLHARHITTDNGWKILMDRGLDIYQRYEMGDAFDLTNRLQQFRSCKAFEITYLRQ